MTTIVEHDAITWVLNRTRYCDDPHCSQDAAVIAATPHNDRFCTEHAATTRAAAVAADVAFTGWYRITEMHYCDHVLVAHVHAI